MAVELLAGRYRLGSKVGEGALSVIYRAQDVHLGRGVAIKVLRAELAGREDVRARFRREAEAAARLNHPNIVSILDIGEAGGRPYIVMEYLPEPDLKEIIVRYAPLADDKVAQVGIDCCRALEWAHRQNLVHRDVKPQNVLFTSDGVAKLADFGLAAAVGEAGVVDGRVLGTAAYMAPEQAQGLPASPQSDIYSLGCVLYEAITGRVPFDGDDPVAVMRRHVHDRPTSLRSLNPDVSPSLEFIVTKAMAKDPARRYRSAREMLTDLQKVAAGLELDRTGVLTVEQTVPVVEPAEAAPWYAERRSADAQQTVAVGARGRTGAASRPPITTALGVVAALLAIIALVWLVGHAFWPGTEPKLVQVPSVKSMTEQEARDRLTAAGLQVGAMSYQTSDMFPEGVVIDQRPEMGNTVAAGTSVSLVINRGQQMAQVPDVHNQALDDAVRALQQGGMALGEVERRYDPKVPEGVVIKQSVRAGTKVERGAAVDLIVSKGPQPAPKPPPTAQTTPPGDQTQPPGKNNVADVYPDVSVRDLSADKPKDKEHRYEVRITVLGQQKQQRVQVIARDASGRREDVLDEKLDPQTARSAKVDLVGPATIEVYHEGRLVWQQTVPEGEGTGAVH
jgi:serine/threonine-protein kinase